MKVTTRGYLVQVLKYFNLSTPLDSHDLIYTDISICGNISHRSTYAFAQGDQIYGWNHNEYWTSLEVCPCQHTQTQQNVQLRHPSTLNISLDDIKQLDASATPPLLPSTDRHVGMSYLEIDFKAVTRSALANTALSTASAQANDAHVTSGLGASTSGRSGPAGQAASSLLGNGITLPKEVITPLGFLQLSCHDRHGLQLCRVYTRPPITASTSSPPSMPCVGVALVLFSPQFIPTLLPPPTYGHLDKKTGLFKGFFGRKKATTSSSSTAEGSIPLDPYEDYKEKTALVNLFVYLIFRPSYPDNFDIYQHFTKDLYQIIKTFKSPEFRALFLSKIRSPDVDHLKQLHQNYASMFASSGSSSSAAATAAAQQFTVRRKVRPITSSLFHVSQHTMGPSISDVSFLYETDVPYTPSIYSASQTIYQLHPVGAQLLLSFLTLCLKYTADAHDFGGCYHILTTASNYEFLLEAEAHVLPSFKAIGNKSTAIMNTAGASAITVSSNDSDTQTRISLLTPPEMEAFQISYQLTQDARMDCLVSVYTFLKQYPVFKTIEFWQFLYQETNKFVTLYHHPRYFSSIEQCPVDMGQSDDEDGGSSKSSKKADKSSSSSLSSNVVKMPPHWLSTPVNKGNNRLSEITSQREHESSSSSSSTSSFSLSSKLSLRGANRANTALQNRGAASNYSALSLGSASKGMLPPVPAKFSCYNVKCPYLELNASFRSGGHTDVTTPSPSHNMAPLPSPAKPPKPTKGTSSGRTASGFSTVGNDLDYLYVSQTQDAYYRIASYISSETSSLASNPCQYDSYIVLQSLLVMMINVGLSVQEIDMMTASFDIDNTIKNAMFSWMAYQKKLIFYHLPELTPSTELGSYKGYSHVHSSLIPKLHYWCYKSSAFDVLTSTLPALTAIPLSSSSTRTSQSSLRVSSSSSSSSSVSLTHPPAHSSPSSPFSLHGFSMGTTSLTAVWVIYSQPFASSSESYLTPMSFFLNMNPSNATNASYQALLTLANEQLNGPTSARRVTHYDASSGAHPGGTGRLSVFGHTPYRSPSLLQPLGGTVPPSTSDVGSTSMLRTNSNISTPASSLHDVHEEDVHDDIAPPPPPPDDPLPPPPPLRGAEIATRNQHNIVLSQLQKYQNIGQLPRSDSMSGGGNRLQSSRSASSSNLSLPNAPPSPSSSPSPSPLPDESVSQLEGQMDSVIGRMHARIQTASVNSQIRQQHSSQHGGADAVSPHRQRLSVALAPSPSFERRSTISKSNYHAIKSPSASSLGGLYRPSQYGRRTPQGTISGDPYSQQQQQQQPRSMFTTPAPTPLDANLIPSPSNGAMGAVSPPGSLSHSSSYQSLTPMAHVHSDSDHDDDDADDNQREGFIRQSQSRRQPVPQQPQIALPATPSSYAPSSHQTIEGQPDVMVVETMDEDDWLVRPSRTRSSNIQANGGGGTSSMSGRLPISFVVNTSTLANLLKVDGQLNTGNLPLSTLSLYTTELSSMYFDYLMLYVVSRQPILRLQLKDQQQQQLTNQSQMSPVLSSSKEDGQSLPPPPPPLLPEALATAVLPSTSHQKSSTTSVVAMSAITSSTDDNSTEVSKSSGTATGDQLKQSLHDLQSILNSTTYTSLSFELLHGEVIIDTITVSCLDIPSLLHMKPAVTSSSAIASPSPVSPASGPAVISGLPPPPVNVGDNGMGLPPPPTSPQHSALHNQLVGVLQKRRDTSTSTYQAPSFILSDSRPPPPPSLPPPPSHLDDPNVPPPPPMTPTRGPRDQAPMELPVSPGPVAVLGSSRLTALNRSTSYVHIHRVEDNKRNYPYDLDFEQPSPHYNNGAPNPTDGSVGDYHHQSSTATGQSQSTRSNGIRQRYQINTKDFLSVFREPVAHGVLTLTNYRLVFTPSLTTAQAHALSLPPHKNKHHNTQCDSCLSTYEVCSRCINYRVRQVYCTIPIHSILNTQVLESQSYKTNGSNSDHLSMMLRLFEEYCQQNQQNSVSSAFASMATPSTTAIKTAGILTNGSSIPPSQHHKSSTPATSSETHLLTIQSLTGIIANWRLIPRNYSSSPDEAVLVIQCKDVRTITFCLSNPVQTSLSSNANNMIPGIHSHSPALRPINTTHTASAASTTQRRIPAKRQLDLFKSKIHDVAYRTKEFASIPTEQLYSSFPSHYHSILQRLTIQFQSKPKKYFSFLSTLYNTFAFKYYHPKFSSAQQSSQLASHAAASFLNEYSPGWNLYDPKKEFERQGVYRYHGFVEIDNSDYKLSPTYPNFLINQFDPVLTSLPHGHHRKQPPASYYQLLKKATELRSKKRLQSLTYFHEKRQSCLFRSSQLDIAYVKSPGHDIELLHQANVKAIYDARPFKAALGNTIKGCTYERENDYKCAVHFCDVPNIHKVTQALFQFSAYVRRFSITNVLYNLNVARIVHSLLLFQHISRLINPLTTTTAVILKKPRIIHTDGPTGINRRETLYDPRPVAPVAPMQPVLSRVAGQQQSVGEGGVVISHSSVTNATLTIAELKQHETLLHSVDLMKHNNTYGCCVHDILAKPTTQSSAASAPSTAGGSYAHASAGAALDAGLKANAKSGYLHVSATDNIPPPPQDDDDDDDDDDINGDDVENDGDDDNCESAQLAPHSSSHRVTTNWEKYVIVILQSAQRICTDLEQGKSVLVHCSDGWDRTSQLCFLAQLMLDPYFRTIKGFCLLIEKDFLCFGHKFSDRCGHGRPHYKECSPIFIQLLDCVYQLISLYPHAFEFDDKLLHYIAHHLYSCQYGTFLFNSEVERRYIARVQLYTVSLWDIILDDMKSFQNTSYIAPSSQEYQNPLKYEEQSWIPWPFLYRSDMNAVYRHQQ